MRIVVCVKQVPDSEAKVTVAGDGVSIDERDITFVVNPYDEYAVEEAVRIKERLGDGSEVAVVSLGPARAEEALRRCLAMGADRATRVWDEALVGVDGAVTARVLAPVVRSAGFDLILCGRVAIDDAAVEIGARLAELLGVPHASAVSKVEVGEGAVVAHREVDGGVEVLELPLPAVLTAQKGLNEPRYPAIPAIMKARRQPVTELGLGDLGVTEADVAGWRRAAIASLTVEATQRRRRIVGGDPRAAAGDLARLLRDEARVL